MEVVETAGLGARSRRVGMERCLLCLTLVLFSSSLGLVLALTQVVGDAGPDRFPPSSATPVGNDSSAAATGRRARAASTDLCVTATCVEVASQLLQYRDTAVDPCQDFHQFACGGWQQESRLLGLSSHTSSYNINSDYMDASVDRKIQKLLDSTQNPVQGIAWAQYFYQHCVNELHGTQEELDQAADYLLQDVVGGLQTGQPPDLTTSLLRLRRLTADALLDVSLLPELSGRPRPAFVVQLPSYDADGSRAHRRRRRHDLSRGHRHSTYHPRLRRASGGGRRPKPRRVTPLTGVTPPPSSGWQQHQQEQEYLQPADYDLSWPDADADGDWIEEEDVDGYWDEDGNGQTTEDDSTTRPRNISRLFEESREEAFAEKLQEFKDYFRESIVGKGFFPEDRSEAELEKMISFLQEFQTIMPKPRERAIMNTRYHLRTAITVAELQEQYPYVDWQRYLAGALRTTVNATDPVYVLFPRYMERLGVLLAKHEPRVVHNTLLVRFRTEFLSDMVAELVGADTDLPAGQRYCASLTRDTFPVAMAALFVRDVGRRKVEELREKVRSIMEEIRSELLRSIEEKAMLRRNPLTGQTDPLLTLAFNKIQSTRFFLMAPEYIWDDDYINGNTPPVSRLWRPPPQSDRVFVRSGRHMLLDMLKGLRRAEVLNFKQELRDLAAPDPYRWPPEVEPLTANAFHMASRNAVGVPLALLTEPYFYDNVPEYVQFAVLGVTLAHELLHGIDNTGFHFDETGAVLQLPDELKRRIADQFRCVKTDYVQALSRIIEIDDVSVDLQMDGDLALLENAADYSSLALTWAAYSRRRQRQGPELRLPAVNLTDRQVFLMSFAQLYCADVAPWSYITMVAADTHPPNPERVNGMVRQTLDFAAAFSCPAGTPMSPYHRCDPVW